MTAIAIINRDAILLRIQAGHRQTDIAKDYGITQQALSKQLCADPEFIQAREIGVNSRLERYERELEQIDGDTHPVVLARTN